MIIEQNDTIDFSKIDSIRRARGYRLYTQQGKRLLDFYQWNGRALLGHRPESLMTRVKNAFSQGVWVSINSRYHSRCLKLAQSITSDYPYAALFASEADFIQKHLPGDAVVDPLYADDSSDAKAVCWRPDMPRPDSDYLLPVLPAAADGLPVLVLSKTTIAGTLASAPIVQWVHEGIKLFKHVLAGGRGTSLPIMDASVFEAPMWERKGRYFIIKPENYTKLWQFFYERGFLLPPAANEPMIAPAEYSKGEATAFKKACRDWEAEW